jgi:uncharacterized membrane protein
MQIDALTFFTILGMALVTYATRAGGLLLMRKVTISKRVKAWLENIPGAVLISIVAPEVFSGHGNFIELAGEFAGIIVTIIVATRTNNLLLSMIAGVGVVCALRFLT